VPTSLQRWQGPMCLNGELPRAEMKRPEVHAKRSLCLDRRDDDLKMPQMRGPCAKCQDEPRGEERARTGPEKAQAGRPVRTGPAHFCGGSGPPLLSVK
jgi:hypothetical protein